MPPFFCVWCMTYYGWLINITSFPHWTVPWSLACFHVSVSADVSQEKGPSRACPQMSVLFSLGQWTPFSPLLLCPQTPIVEYVCEPLAPVPITSNMKWQLPTLHIIRFSLGPIKTQTLKTIIVAIFFLFYSFEIETYYVAKLTGNSKSSCLCHLCAGITGMEHHIQLKINIKTKRFVPMEQAFFFFNF